MVFIIAPSKCCKPSKEAKLKGRVLKCKEAVITCERASLSSNIKVMK